MKHIATLKMATVLFLGHSDPMFFGVKREILWVNEELVLILFIPEAGASTVFYHKPSKAFFFFLKKSLNPMSCFKGLVLTPCRTLKILCHSFLCLFLSKKFDNFRCLLVHYVKITWFFVF